MDLLLVIYGMWAASIDFIVIQFGCVETNFLVPSETRS